MMGRPTCVVLSAAINTARTAASFGCVGTRVYTASTTRAYFPIPGPQLTVVEDSLAGVVRANEALATFHRARAAEMLKGVTSTQ